MSAPVQITHFSDPCCPWAYSANPHLAQLHWRYRDALDWRLVLIGLTERSEQYVERGYTPLRMASGFRSFRDRGMPFATEPKDRVPGTALACRAVVATRLIDPAREWEVFRALQFAQFTTTLMLDDPVAIGIALQRVEGLDIERITGMLQSDEVTEAYEADRAEARTAEGGPTEFQGKSAASDGPVRYTAPSLILQADGRSLEAGGFQSWEAYDVCVANLDTSIERHEPAEDVVELLGAFPAGLTTYEVAACMAQDKFAPDPAAAEDALIAAVAEGQVRRESLGSGALWRRA
jgi:predicted DsbA family dithiol-disulfide isomerase